VNNRVDREKLAYDESRIFEFSHALQVRFEHVFLSPNTLLGEAFFSDQIAKHSKNSVILDYGCLFGALAPELHLHGPKKIIGIDISEKGIDVAKENHSDIAEFYVMDAHKMDFEDSSIDLVIGRGILHHLDFEVAIDEINRVLKPGGKALFNEPLRDNPGAHIFRLLTPKARTIDELPLSRKQINYADNVFGGHEHFCVNLITTPFAMLTSLLRIKPDNFILRMCNTIDLFLQKTIFKYWMRSAYLVWIKK